MSATRSLIGAADALSAAKALIEAVWMAAASIPDVEQTDAIQQVCHAAQSQISDAAKMIDKLKHGGLS